MEKKLTRPTNGKMIGGVCSGLAKYIEVDVTFVRLGFAAVTLFTGIVFGILFYILACIIIPTEPTI